jgi:orotate phosphoribosyltransferase
LKFLQKEQFLTSLHNVDSLKFGSFILASGNKSNFYLDLRLIPSHPELFEITGNLLVSKARDLDYDIIVGIPTAGVPFASYIAIDQKKPLIYLRKESKGHGMKKKIEGISVNNKKVLLVDDLISSGFSKEFAIKNIRDEGGIVDNVLVIIDRRAREIDYLNWERENKVEVVSLFQFSVEEIQNFGNVNNIRL